MSQTILKVDLFWMYSATIVPLQIIEPEIIAAANGQKLFHVKPAAMDTGTILQVELSKWNIQLLQGENELGMVLQSFRLTERNIFGGLKYMNPLFD